MADDRAHQYRDRAEIRTCAEGMKDQSAKDTMLCLAESYDRMAARESAGGPINRQSVSRLRRRL
jgi:hypothetical protein